MCQHQDTTQVVLETSYWEGVIWYDCHLPQVLQPLIGMFTMIVKPHVTHNPHEMDKKTK